MAGLSTFERAVAAHIHHVTAEANPPSLSRPVRHRAGYASFAVTVAITLAVTLIAYLGAR